MFKSVTNVAGDQFHNRHRAKKIEDYRSDSEKSYSLDNAQELDQRPARLKKHGQGKNEKVLGFNKAISSLETGFGRAATNRDIKSLYDPTDSDEADKNSHAGMFTSYAGS